MEFTDLEKGLATFRVIESKLRDLNSLTPSPTFWYDINISTNNKGHVVVFLNTGSHKYLNFLEDDFEMP